MNRLEENLPKLALITPGWKPVPDVAGGAVEHLITHIILRNEQNPRYYIEVFTIFNEALSCFDFHYTHLNYVKDWRRNFFKRGFSFCVNGFYKKTHSNRRFNLFAFEVAKKMDKNISAVLMENDLDVLRAIKPRLPKVPVIFHMHNDFDTLGELQKTTLSMQWTIKNVNEIWAVSNYIHNHITSVFSNAVVKTFPNCIDHTRFSPNAVSTDKIRDFKERYGITADDFTILYTGRIIPQKGVLELIEACALLPHDMPFKLLIVGDITSAPKVYRKKLYAAAESIKNKVVFTGYIPHYEIQTAYAVAGIVTVPSQWQEAFCLTALEASCHCKPCVASVSGGMSEVLDSSCAEMVELGDDFVQRFSAAIFTLYRDENLRTVMSANAGKKSATFADEKKYFENFCVLMQGFLCRMGEEK